VFHRRSRPTRPARNEYVPMPLVGRSHRWHSIHARAIGGEEHIVWWGSTCAIPGTVRRRDPRYQNIFKHGGSARPASPAPRSNLGYVPVADHAPVSSGPAYPPPPRAPHWQATGGDPTATARGKARDLPPPHRTVSPSLPARMRAAGREPMLTSGASQLRRAVPDRPLATHVLLPPPRS
jgi:hypothetical protein